MAACLIFAICAARLAAQTLDDRRLTVLPRTEAETARIAGVLAPTTDFSKPEAFEEMPAGAATVRAIATADAFSQFSANTPFDRQADFKIGNALVRKFWVASPASTLASDGLGPLYNARACQDCHLKVGREHVPLGPGEKAVSMFLCLSVPAGTTPHAIEGWLATPGDPTYGGQLQDFAAPGQVAEGRKVIDYTDLPMTLADGEVVVLRKPIYSVPDLGYGPMAANVMLSPRVAPQMIGVGLLEAIPAACRR